MWPSRPESGPARWFWQDVLRGLGALFTRDGAGGLQICDEKALAEESPGIGVEHLFGFYLRDIFEQHHWELGGCRFAFWASGDARTG